MTPENSTEPLVALGFTGLESEIYSLLLRESAVTGYRIAKGLRKPAANVYKAIEALEAKGAVMVDQGRHRVRRGAPRAARALPQAPGARGSLERPAHRPHQTGGEAALTGSFKSVKSG